MIRLAILLIFIALPVMADEMQIDPHACKILTAHSPAPDVVYQPGVDVHGKAVAPADLSSQPELGSNITIPLTVDLAEQFNIPMNKAVDSRATVALVTVDDGNVYLNGQPLSAGNQENMAVLCLEANGKHP